MEELAAGTKYSPLLGKLGFFLTLIVTALPWCPKRLVKNANTS
jgi:hypothetical protein